MPAVATDLFAELRRVRAPGRQRGLGHLAQRGRTPLTVAGGVALITLHTELHTSAGSTAGRASRAGGAGPGCDTYSSG